MFDFEFVNKFQISQIITGNDLLPDQEMGYC